MGRALSALSRWQEAVDAFTAAALRYKGKALADALFHRGVAREKLGRREEAFADYVRAAAEGSNPARTAAARLEGRT